MLMIPLPFVIALCSAAFGIFEVSQRGLSRRNGWLLALLAVFTFQEVLVGLRFGYGLEGLRLVQPLSASLIPPLAYLSFARPAVEPRTLVHLWPLLLVILILLVWIDLIDTALALNGLIYVTLLLRLGLGGSDALGWVETHRSSAVLILLWIVAAVLIASCLTDLAIVYDFWVTEGANTGVIAGWTSGLALIGLGGALSVVYLRKARAKPVAPQGTEDTEATFAALEALMAREELHLDPDINLNRIARRLVKPARDVSRAVNAQAGCNVSQYINKLRVDAACQMLANTQMPVTQVIYAAGFNTKSNFNREFARITGQAPSVWRASHV